MAPVQSLEKTTELCRFVMCALTDPLIILGSSTGATSLAIELVFARDSIFDSVFQVCFGMSSALGQVVSDGFERC